MLCKQTQHGKIMENSGKFPEVQLEILGNFHDFSINFIEFSRIFHEFSIDVHGIFNNFP